ncbi:MAG TPA: sugar ABC transporter permease [Spirochaetia bacterium]|nr:sugar ABC transporter permease [Spirochaetia bacterium]
MKTNARAASLPTLILLIGPAFVLFTVLVVAPVVQAAIYSLYKWNGMGPLVDFRGLQNFKNLLADPVFQKALWHNVLIVIVSLGIEIPMALGLALIIGRSDFKLAVFFRTFFFLPYVLSEVITGVMWQFIYHPQYGLVRAIWLFFSPGTQPPILLADPKLTLWMIMIVIVWKYFGLHMTILIAGLQNIPQELREAARIDGASRSQANRYVILPLLRTTIQLSVFFSIIGSFQVFDVVWAMGKGDPVNAAETMVTYLYKFGLQRLSIGYGSAVALTIFVICLAFSIFYQRTVARERD